MKKIVILTALFTSLFTASYAQQANISNAPVYGNDRNEQLMATKNMEKNALIDNRPAQTSQLLTERISLTETKKTDKSLFKIDAPDSSNGLKRYDIKKVTFPKPNYLMP